MRGGLALSTALSFDQHNPSLLSLLKVMKWCFFAYRSPVSLKNIQRVPSNRTSADFDIRVGFASELSTPVRALDFDFQPPPMLQTTTIKDIEQNLNAFQKVKRTRFAVHFILAYETKVLFKFLLYYVQ